MEISSENKARLKLLTVNEVASLLQMNSQVVARKLCSGEIEGYKLGKDWRVSEEQLLRYLESHKNINLKKDIAAKTIQSFIKNGRLIEIPASRSKRLHILCYLVQQLDESKVYTEKELNLFIKQFHSDVCTLRREFIANKLMVRKQGKYKRISWSF